jgi:tetraacyldisaccharide 4'-kinase
MRSALLRCVERWLNRIWYGGASLLDELLAIPLWPISAITLFVAKAKTRTGFPMRTQDEPPVIVVGNLTAGGTGKTPIVIALVVALKARGYSPGVISRGYKSSHPSNDLTQRQSDEARLIAQRAQVKVECNPQRREALHALKKNHPTINVVVSDDGLQHTALPRDFEIVVVDAARGFGSHALLPYGPLREPVTRLATVNAILLNGEKNKGVQSDIDVWANDVPVMDTSVSLTRIRPMLEVDKTEHELHTVDAFKRRWLAILQAKPTAQLAALAGIGNPNRFFEMLNQHHIQTHASLIFSDHHPYVKSELELSEYAMILITQKDELNFPAQFLDNRFWVVEIDAVIPDALIDSIVQKLINLNIKPGTKL